MWLVTVLLLWGPVGGQVVNPTKAVVTVQPPWVSIFKKESVTLRCEGPRLPGDSATQWFINRTALQISSPSHSITEAGFKDGGEYSCKTSLSVLSDPVQLEIHSDWLLLQASRRALIEGEPLALRCHRWKTVPDIHVVFWRNGKSFWFTHGSEVTIQKTNPSHSGIYHCTGKQKKSGRFWKSAGTAVTVKELFAVPELRASSPFLEGSLITLSCETKPQLQSPGLQLYFSFYVGNKTLADRNTSSEYRIPSAGREDSGFYWCEAATEDGSIRKRSSELELQVLGLQSSTPFWVHNLFYLSMGVMFLVSTVLCVKIYKKLQRMKKYKLEVPLISDQEKKATSFQQVRSNDAYEDVRQTAPKVPRSSVGSCGPQQPESFPPPPLPGSRLPEAD